MKSKKCCNYYPLSKLVTHRLVSRLTHRDAYKYLFPVKETPLYGVQERRDGCRRIMMTNANTVSCLYPLHVA